MSLSTSRIHINVQVFALGPTCHWRCRRGLALPGWHPHLIPWCIGTPAECADERTKMHNDLLVSSTRSISAPDSGARPGTRRERANVAVLITLAEPTGPMRTEAVRAGFYKPAYGERPKVQLLSVAELIRSQIASYALARPWRVQESRARGSRSWQANKAAALRERIKCQRMA